MNKHFQSMNDEMKNDFFVGTKKKNKKLEITIRIWYFWRYIVCPKWDFVNYWMSLSQSVDLCDKALHDTENAREGRHKMKWNDHRTQSKKEKKKRSDSISMGFFSLSSLFWCMRTYTQLVLSNHLPCGSFFFLSKCALNIIFDLSDVEEKKKNTTNRVELNQKRTTKKYIKK